MRGRRDRPRFRLRIATRISRRSSWGAHWRDPAAHAGYQAEAKPRLSSRPPPTPCRRTSRTAPDRS
jgi:hypothetical protein